MSRPFYFNHGVVEFSSKRGQNFYKVSVWDKEGMNLSLLKSGKYKGEDPKSLIPLVMKGDYEK